MKNCGIYVITNIVNNKKYIGQSKNLRERKNIHFAELKRNNHYNKYLQHSYNKYGKKSFIFKILLYCEQFELTRYEQFFVDSINPEYNICKICVNSPLGTKRSRLARIKNSVTNRVKYNYLFEKTIISNIMNNDNDNKNLYVDKNGNIKSKTHKKHISKNNETEHINGITNYSIIKQKYERKYTIARKPKHTKDIIDKCETIWNILIDNKDNGISVNDIIKIMDEKNKKITAGFLTTFQSNNYLYYKDNEKVKPYRHPSGIIIEQT